MRLAVLAALGVAFSLLLPAVARAADCHAPANASIVQVPGFPFGMAAASDGCWIFVSMWTGRKSGALTVLHDSGDTFSVAREVPLSGGGSGETLTHDGKLLIVTQWNGDVAAYDVGKLELPSGDPLLGTLREGRYAGAVYAITSLDDRLLFVSDESDRRLSVYDLAKWRRNGFKRDPLIGYVPTAAAPVGLALSPDGKWLYSTSQKALPQMGVSSSCRPETGRERRHPQGLLLRIDVDKAAKHPRDSLSGGVQAGCNPVRVAMAPDGNYLWVSARDSNAVLRIPASSLTAHGHVDVTSFNVGGGPVGIAVRPDGKQVWIAVANRFANTKYNPQGREVVGLLDTAGTSTDQITAVSEPASAFPRELIFLPDARTFAVGLFDAKRIEFFTTPP
ncbi:MAG TPA: hypothetical protein VKV22_00550 [Rhodanobacteraceae bacterium]|nr:hypothetical protein [Rhodanobacteraceae bacterium]